MGCTVIVGLPRSGTSAVAGVVHRLGIGMGERLLPPAPPNPKGFFEDEDFLAMHVRLLGGRHFAPEARHLRPADDPAWAEYAALIGRRNGGPAWGLKDPKLCFLLPHFLARQPAPVRVVTTTRRFNHTVASYRRLWGGIELNEAVRRLGHYAHAMSANLETLETTATGTPVHRVSYEALCRDPRRAVEGLAAFLGVPFTFEAAAFVDPALDREGQAR